MPRRGSITVGRIRAARWIALGVAGVLAATIALLWFLGRDRTPDLTAGERADPRGARQVGKGFDHTITHEGKPLLRIRGKRDRYDKDGNLHVEEVLITAYQQDGSRYEIAADKATYNLQQREAVLDGRVSLAGPQGFALRTRKLTLKQGGRWLVSDSQVSFQWGTDPPLAGRAARLHAQLNRGEFVLAGGVAIRSLRQPAEGEAQLEPFRISADVMVFERSLHTLRANARVLLKYGRSQLRADRLAVHLSPEENKVQFVRARWNVRAEIHDQDAQGRMTHLFSQADTLAVLFDEAGKQPQRLELDGDGKTPAHLRRRVEGGELFDLVASRTEAELAAGRLTSAQATGGVVITQEAQAPVRKVQARRAEAEFASDGTLASLTIKGDVRVQEPGRGELLAARAIVTPERTDAFGEPGAGAASLVRLDSPRGQLRAPQITYTKDSGLAHATGGVEATMPPGKDNPMEDTPLTESGEPVNVQAEEAFWRDQPRAFLFKGKVRAWSGDRVLRADQLRGDADQQQLTAAGSVQTLWFMPPPKAEEGEAGAGGPRQVRVESATLLYSEREHRLVYDGNVHVVDGQRTLDSKTLTVELTQKGQARRMIATGGVELEAPAEGRTITAERADYDVEARRVVFRGAPVTLKDQKGGTLSGKQAVYSMATGKVRVTAGEEEGPD